MSSAETIRASRPLLLVIGGITALVGAVLGTFVLGPLVRRVVGTPTDYGSDYASSEALRQALVVLGGSLVVAFVASGWVVARRWGAVRWRRAVWLANPLTVGVPFLLLQLVADGTYVVDGQVTLEYIGVGMGGIQALVAMPLYGSAAIAGGAWSGAASSRERSPTMR